MRGMGPGGCRVQRPTGRGEGAGRCRVQVAGVRGGLEVLVRLHNGCMTALGRPRMARLRSAKSDQVVGGCVTKSGAASAKCN